MERNKSKWYIKRFVTTIYTSIGVAIDVVYEARDDKEPEEVEVGDAVVIPLKNSNGHSYDIVGEVVKIELYDDGLYKISVDSPDHELLLLTTPNRIGILRKGVKKDGK